MNRKSVQLNVQGKDCTDLFEPYANFFISKYPLHLLGIK